MDAILQAISGCRLSIFAHTVNIVTTFVPSYLQSRSLHKSLKVAIMQMSKTRKASSLFIPMFCLLVPVSVAYFKAFQYTKKTLIQELQNDGLDSRRAPGSEGCTCKPCSKLEPQASIADSVLPRSKSMCPQKRNLSHVNKGALSLRDLEVENRMNTWSQLILRGSKFPPCHCSIGRIGGVGVVMLIAA